MGSLVNINSYKIDRKRYEFKVKSALLHDENRNLRSYFCIALVDSILNKMVCITGLEKYVVDLSCATIISESTERQAMSRVINFLNYILYNTSVNSLNELTVNEIRGFLIDSKTKSDGQEMKSTSWKKIRNDVFVFLENYYKYHHDVVEFGYNGDDLRSILIMRDKELKRGRKYVVSEYKSLNVKAPKSNDHKHRKRTIMYGHLDAFLYTARKYEPMIYLAITLQAYAGLREGEVANLSFTDITQKIRLGVVERISIELSTSDKFRKGKTHTGVIKKLRTQDVYPDFLDNVRKAIEFHKNYLQALGLPTEGDGPIFYNKHRKAMAVKTLTSRIKDLFENYFLEILKETSDNTEFEGETQAYIEAYEDEYPGAHMFRHWFTMYLIAIKNLRPEEVRKWRGDAPNSNAYEEYMHYNYDLLQAYKNTAYSFQECLINEICK